MSQRVPKPIAMKKIEKLPSEAPDAPEAPEPPELQISYIQKYERLISCRRVLMKT